MGQTSFEVFYTRFFDKVEKDPDFFDYYNCTPEEALDIATTRASNYLEESIGYFTSRCNPTVDFSDIDTENQCFNFEATSNEIEIIGRIMFYIYLERDISVLKPIINSLSSSEVKALFSPANERKTFNDMLENYRLKTDKLIKSYISRDRITGKRRTISYEM